tara:strand:+ start:1241 stop:3400 length:2160 start_codon:yes stop_codon:yes gene_type:complete
MNLNRLEVNNFGSFGENNVVDFSLYDPNDRILVIGENRDSAGSDSNGSGKSTLFNAISWAIFGKLPNNVDVEDVIRRGTSETSVKLLLKSTEFEIMIVRTRNQKKQFLSFFVNGEDKTLRTTQQTQLALLQYFGILESNKNYFTDFLNTTYFSIAAIQSFAGKESTAKDRLDLIARFLNLELLDKCLNRTKVHSQHAKTKLTQHLGQLEYLSDKIENNPDPSTLKQDNANLNNLIDNLEIENKKLNYNLKSAEEKKQVTIDLQDLRSQISRLKSDSEQFISMLTNQKDEYEIKLNSKNTLLKEVEKIELSLAGNSIKDLHSKRDKLKDHLKKGTTKLSRLKEVCGSHEKKIFFYQSQLDHIKHCPKCGDSLMIVDGDIQQLDSVQLKREINAHHSQLEGVTKEYQDLHKSISEFEEKVKSADSDVENLILNEGKLTNLRSKIKELEQLPDLIELTNKKIKEKEKSDKKYLKQLNSKSVSLEVKLLKYKGVDENLVEAYKENIDDNVNKIRNHRDEVARNQTILSQIKSDYSKFKKLKEKEKNLLKDVSDYQFWIEGFPQIRTWMIESFLPSFEEQVNTYLNRMEVGMRIRFQTFKEKKTKKKGTDKYKYQFNIQIIDENNNKRNLETYSAGESKRIGVAVGFALRELTLTRGYNSFEFLLLDEVVDSLDETGILEFFELLNIISGLKFVISHNSSLKTRFSKVIRVTKEDGKSTVAQIS